MLRTWRCWQPGKEETVAEDHRNLAPEAEENGRESAERTLAVAADSVVALVAGRTRSSGVEGNGNVRSSTKGLLTPADESQMAEVMGPM